MKKPNQSVVKIFGQVEFAIHIQLVAFVFDNVKFSTTHVMLSAKFILNYFNCYERLKIKPAI